MSSILRGMRCEERQEDGSAACRYCIAGKVGAAFAGKGTLGDKFLAADITEMAAHPVREYFAEDRTVGFRAGWLGIGYFVVDLIHVFDF